MARRYGRALRGHRCRLAVPLGHRKTTTVTAALRTTGLVATMFEAQPTASGSAATWQTSWSRRLRPATPWSWTTFVHKVAGVREAVAAAGARLLYLPPCSPDFNPIEQAFAKLKALLRNAAARTVTDLHAAIRHASARFTPQECRNYVTAAGYEDDAAVST